MEFKEIWEKFELYILSLWFLFFLIIVVTFDIPTCFGESCEFAGFMTLLKGNVVALIALLFVVIGIIFFFRFNYKLTGSKSLSVRIDKIDDINYEHLTFLTTYIIPLICFNLTSPKYVVALGLLLTVIGIIYVKTDKFYVNPTLAVLGFKLYQVEISTRTGMKSKIILITTDQLTLGDQVKYQKLDEKVYFAKKVI